MQYLKRHHRLTIALHLYCTCRYSKSLVQFRLAVFGAVAGSVAAITATTVVTSSPQMIAGVASASTILTIGVHFWQNRVLQQKIDAVSSIEGRDGLEAVYKRLYARQIIDGDEYTADLWRKVREHFQVSWGGQIDIHNMPKISSADFQLLEYIMESDIPSLRRRTAPAFTAPPVPNFGIASDSESDDEEKVRTK